MLGCTALYRTHYCLERKAQSSKLLHLSISLAKKYFFATLKESWDIVEILSTIHSWVKLTQKSFALSHQAGSETSDNFVTIINISGHFCV
jgi:hypothetical protein